MKRATFLRNFQAIVKLAAGTVLFAAAAEAKDYQVTARGEVWCYDGSTKQRFPLGGVMVWLMDSDCNGSELCDDFMGAAIADKNGKFEIVGHGGDPGDYSWSRPDVYLQVRYIGDGAALIDELKQVHWNSTPQHDHNNTADGSVVDFGVNTISEGADDGWGTMCGVWKKAEDAANEYESVMNAPPPYDYQQPFGALYWAAIWNGYPWTSRDTVHWPRGFSTTVMRHEFAHSIRHVADGDSNHFTWDTTRFRYARYHEPCDGNANRIPSDSETMDLAFAFNEGWADYWSGGSQVCPANSWGDRLEGNVGRDLSLLSGTPNVDRRRMTQTLLNNPYKIHSLSDFRAALAQGLGTSASALSQAVNSLPPDVVKSRVSPGLAIANRARRRSDAETARVLKSTIDETSGVVRVRSAERDRAASRAAGVMRCAPRSCEEAIAEVMKPAILDSQVQIASLRVARLKSMASPTARALQKRQFASGQFEPWLDRQGKTWLAMERRIVLAGMEKALRDARRLSSDPEARAILADLEIKHKKLRANMRGKGWPANANPQIILKADRMITALR